MDAETAAERFAELYPAVYRRFHRRVELSEYRPSRESLAVLEHLAATGPLTVGEAASHLNRSQAATSEIIQRLVGRGMLARMPDERDRRRVLVWLTSEGRETLGKSRRVLADELLLPAFKELRLEDRERLIAGMEQLLATQPEEKNHE